MTNNYFRTADNDIFTFDDSSEDDTTRAFDLAREGQAAVCVFKVPSNPGPWDRCAVVGFRLRGKIIFEIKRTKDHDRRYWLEEELRSLDREYIAAGRATAVAA